MSFVEAYLLGALAILGLMVLLWLVSLALRNSSIVDIFWGPGFMLVGWLYFALTPEGDLFRKVLVTALVTIWGLRLGTHIFIRNHGKCEDYRYQQFRKDAGQKWWWYSFFKVFFLQGVLMWVISAPLLWAQASSGFVAPGPLEFLALALWAFGFAFEAGGDWQLSRFKADPANRGKLLDTGLWRYTRHPNYFGDAAQWWAFYLIALATGAWWTIFSPLIITTLLMRVSGVALLERKLKETKPDYREYVESTNAFFPWFPKKGKQALKS